MNSFASIAASKNCEKLTQEIFGGEMAYVRWMRPGFELGLAMQEICRKEPKAKSIMMGQHGFISWDDNEKACYTRTRYVDGAIDGETLTGVVRDASNAVMPGATVKAESLTNDPTMINRLRAGETNVWDLINVNNPWARKDG